MGDGIKAARAGSGRQQMLQRMARAGWGRIEGGVFTINDAWRALAAKDG